MKSTVLDFDTIPKTREVIEQRMYEEWAELWKLCQTNEIEMKEATHVFDQKDSPPTDLRPKVFHLKLPSTTFGVKDIAKLGLIFQWFPVSL